MWVVFAAVLYQPLLNRPYEVQDFPDLLLLMRQGTSAFDTVGILFDYMISNGRLNLVVALQLVLKWKAFGEAMPLWHLARACEMALLAALTFRLLRRLGCSQAGALVASTIFLVSPAAALSWTRMIIGEPIGAIVLVLLCLLLQAPLPQRLPPSRFVALSLMVILLGLVKEVFLVAVPVVTFALIGFEARGRPSLSLFLRDSRVHAVVVGGVLVVIPVVVVALSAPPQAYSGHFGVASISAANFLMPLLGTLLPFGLTSSPLSSIELLAIALYVAGMVGSWGMALKDKAFAGRWWLLLFGFGLPVVGALVYTPWAKYRLYHALPFQLGTALLVAIAVTRLLEGVRYVRVAAFAAFAFIAAPMLAFASGWISFQDASRDLTRDTAVWLGRLPPSAAATLEVCGLPVHHFSGYEHFLPSYALSLGLTTPSVRPRPCDGEGRRDPGTSDAWRIMLSDSEPLRSAGAVSTVYQHTDFDLRMLRFQQHTMVVTTWPPS
jgi:hypothetical protein